MFSKIRNFIDELEAGIFETLRQTINDNKMVLTDYITENQLFEKGIDGDGNRLPGYRRTTIRIKISKGQPANRTTLRDSGDFHASIMVDAFSDRLEISSNVSYDTFIIQRYGKPILKITKENWEDFFRDYFLPNLTGYVNNKKSR